MTLTPHSTPSFLTAIPVFNEEKYLARVLAQVRRYSENILVIDDGSADATPDILARRQDIRLITHPTNLGYGQSLVDAFAYAQSSGFDWLLTIDCDEQHEPARIPDFMARAANDDVDIISGTRYPHGHEANNAAPWDRREINQRITRLVNERLGMNVTDSFCGFKAYRVATLSRVAITEPGYAMPMQWWVQIARAGLRLAELPVPLIYNDDSRSFGGALDDPAIRLQHYLDVFEREWARTDAEEAAAVSASLAS